MAVWEDRQQERRVERDRCERCGHHRVEHLVDDPVRPCRVCGCLSFVAPDNYPDQGT
jgi:hypothetical protein